VPDVETIHAQIRARLSEVESILEPLRLEAEQLASMVAAFERADPPKARATRSSPTRRASRRAPRRVPATGAKRGRPLGSGNRAQQAVSGIGARPGITASELATSMGISVNYLYRVLPRLQREGKVTKQGRGYHPAGAPAPPTPPEEQAADA
jgi:CRP-like cAMP-binding protein